MSEFLLLVGLIFFVLSIILNISNARKKGNKRGIAFFISLVSLLLPLALHIVLIRLDPSQNKADSLGMLAFAGSVVGLSISTFLFYKNGGRSGWKGSKPLSKVLVFTLILPTIALAATDITMSINSNSAYDRESAVISSVISQIEQESSWTKRVEIYKSATIDSIRKRKEVLPALEATIELECPNFEDVWNRPNLKEDWEVYEEYGPSLPSVYYRARLGEQPTNDILAGLRDLLAFYQKVGIKLGEVEDAIYFMFPQYAFDESVNMKPDVKDYQNTESIEYDSHYKYIVLYQNRNKDLFIVADDMISFQTSETIPASLDEIDLAIIVADFADGRAAQYQDGSAATGLRTNICVYDYKSGELLGLIDTIFQGPRGWVSGAKSGMPDSPTHEAQRIVGAFFGIY